MITVYTAELIRTMDAGIPEASAVAVRDGVILGVGTLESLQPWLSADEHVVDRTFENNVLLPGLVDPHIHPMLPALLTQMPFIAPDSWDLPTGFFPGATTPEAYWDALLARFAGHDGDEPFFTWGYSPWFHGGMTRAQLDERVSSTVPVVLWDRSFHGIVMNTPALAWFGITGVESLSDVPGARDCADLGEGHFWEAGLSSLMGGVQRRFMTPERIQGGLATFAAMVRHAGVTTVCDMGLGLLIKPEWELGLQQYAFGDPACGFRVFSVPIETAFVQEGCTPEEVVERLDAMRAQTAEGNVRVGKQLKLMADGAFYSQGFRLCSPGYIDGHEGDWIVPPPITEQIAHAAWDAGYQLHIHCNGDEGADFALGLAARCFEQHPRLDHRFTMEHWGYATDEQNRRAAALGIQVSGQPYYVRVLGDKYGESGLGRDRAAMMSRFGTVLRYGMPLALHSDCPMAPVDPLELARAAVHRRTLDGNVRGEGEQLTVEQALRAITIDAAWILRQEESIGSVRAGKRADFTALDRDPLSDLDGARVVGSVFEGKPVADGPGTSESKG